MEWKYGWTCWPDWMDSSARSRRVLIAFHRIEEGANGIRFEVNVSVQSKNESLGRHAFIHSYRQTLSLDNLRHSVSQQVVHVHHLPINHKNETKKNTSR